MLWDFCSDCCWVEFSGRWDTGLVLSPEHQPLIVSQRRASVWSLLFPFLLSFLSHLLFLLLLLHHLPSPHPPYPPNHFVLLLSLHFLFPPPPPILLLHSFLLPLLHPFPTPHPLLVLLNDAGSNTMFLTVVHLLHGRKLLHWCRGSCCSCLTKQEVPSHSAVSGAQAAVSARRNLLVWDFLLGSSCSWCFSALFLFSPHLFSSLSSAFCSVVWV